MIVAAMNDNPPTAAGNGLGIEAMSLLKGKATTTTATSPQLTPSLTVNGAAAALNGAVEGGEGAGKAPAASPRISERARKSIADLTNTPLSAGYHRFKDTYFGESRDLFKELQHAQAPKTCLIGCCDSRVDPAIITQCSPGDLFVIRNVANLVAPFEQDLAHHGTASALEYAVKVLEVQNIIILGHSKCGGIQSLIDGTCSQLDFMDTWMDIARPALQRTRGQFEAKGMTMLSLTSSPPHPDRSTPKERQDYATFQRACEQASILESLENLLTYPWITERLDKQTLSITGWFFDFMNGALSAFDAGAVGDGDESAIGAFKELAKRVPDEGKEETTSLLGGHYELAVSSETDLTGAGADLLTPTAPLPVS